MHPTMYYVTDSPDDILAHGLHHDARLCPTLDSARTWANWQAREHGGRHSIIEVDVTDIPLCYEGVVDERYGMQFRLRRVRDPLGLVHKEVLEKDAGGLPVVTQVAS